MVRFFAVLYIKQISENDNKKLPIIAGGILVLLAFTIFFTHAYPTWFIIAGLIISIPSTLLGHELNLNKIDG